MNIAAIVLAAGKGTRLGSDKPKVLHEIGGQPMIKYSLEKLEQLGIKDIVVVVGYGADQVKSTLGAGYLYAFQENATGGTSDAVKTGLTKVKPSADTILVLYGDDSAFYKVPTLQEFINYHQKSGNVVSVITADQPQSERVGRIIRDQNGLFEASMEVWEYEKSGLNSDEINCCVYLFNKIWLEENIKKIKNDNEKKEYRITDILNIARAKGTHVGLFKLSNPKEWVGVNTQEDLQKADQLMRSQT